MTADGKIPLFGHSPGEQIDAWSPGAWDQVRTAFLDGRITEPAYATLYAELRLLGDIRDATRALVDRGYCRIERNGLWHEIRVDLDFDSNERSITLSNLALLLDIELPGT